MLQLLAVHTESGTRGDDVNGGLRNIEFAQMAKAGKERIRLTLARIEGSTIETNAGTQFHEKGRIKQQIRSGVHDALAEFHLLFVRRGRQSREEDGGGRRRTKGGSR